MSDTTTEAERVSQPKPERPRRTRALIAERHACVPRDVRVLGPTRYLAPGCSSVLVLVRVDGERESLWIARERLLDGGAPSGSRPEDERPEHTSERPALPPGGPPC